MKKIVIALFASVALVLGTGAFVNGASAAPYPGTVATTTAIASKGTVAENRYFTVRVVVNAGNATVSEGTAKVIFGGRKYVAKVKNNLATFKVKAPKVNKTKKKTLKASFKAAASSVYKPSGATKSIKVRNIKK